MPSDPTALSSQINLAERLGPSEVSQIAKKVYEDFSNDLDSGSTWRDKHAEYLELYHQTHKPSKQMDWQSDSSLPLLTEACNQFQARGYKAFFSNRNFVAASPMAKASATANDVAERVGKHMSYQLGVADRNYKRDKNAMLLATALHGSDFSKAYFDPLKNKNCVERIRATDMVVPYGTGPRRLEDLERKTQIIYKSLNDGRILTRMGFFAEPPVPMDMKIDNSIQQAVDDAYGLQDSDPYRLDRAACILEQHCLLDIDGDGIAEPYIAWVDKTSKHLLRLQIRYETTQGFEASNAKKPIEYFTHYGFLPNPDGFYGLGMGHVLAKLNIACNRILRETEDAGVLANIGNMGGFIGEVLGTKGGDITLDLGKFVKTSRSVDDIRKYVYQFQFPGPNAAYMQIMEMLIQTAQRIGSTTDAVTGDVNKVLQPLTIMTMLEQSLQMPTSIMEQLVLSFEEEFEKIYRLNRLYLTDNDYFMDGKQQLMVTPEDYQENLRITPILDPKLITQQQKVAKAQALFEFSIKDPVLASSPQAMTEITRRVLQSMDTEDVEQILPPPPQVQRVDSQELENMYYLLPPEMRPLFDIFPDQNHLEHIQRVDAFINYLTAAKPLEGIPLQASTDPVIDQAIQGMGEQAKQEIVTQLMAHRRKHVAFMYGQKEGVIDGQGQAISMGQAGGNSMGAPGASSPFQAPPGLENMSFGSGGALPGSNPGFGSSLPANFGGDIAPPQDILGLVNPQANPPAGSGVI